MNREDIPMLNNNNLIYFDNGATTLKPQLIIDSIVEYYSKYCSNAHRGDYKTSLKIIFFTAIATVISNIGPIYSIISNKKFKKYK